MIFTTRVNSYIGTTIVVPDNINVHICISIHSLEAGATAGATAKATEERKLKANTGKCADLGWVCVPVVAESYGAWGLTARDFFSKLGSRLATSLGKSKSVVGHGV